MNASRNQTVPLSCRQAQLSYRYASDSRNAPENCGLLRPLSICGAKNHCPFRGHLALTGSTLMCWRRCSRNAVRTVGRRKSRLDHRFSLGALQSELPPPWHVWCLNRSAPHNALISSYIFSSGGKVGSGIGTAGQSVSGTDKGGTRAGTATVPARMKAPEKLAFLRDRQRDKGWDNGDERPVPTVPPTSSRWDASGTVTGVSAALDLGVLPTRPCSDCGGDVWWRLSMLSDGPGPWRCERCQPPDPDQWRDACACPVTEVQT